MEFISVRQTDVCFPSDELEDTGANLTDYDRFDSERKQ